ncbi:MAG: DUF2797 domain-containing protein [Gammaproteobacteria bacterium]|nr:DUF2797 domain-containing protein [Pseudomonadales bacterium]MCP5346007.1 DUF2797 domain-containing protein [Pseudomonadales bacterium]
MHSVASGTLRKMLSRLEDPVAYRFRLGDEEVPVNPLLGQTVALSFNGEIHCVYCGRETKKSFNQGYCYPCFQKLARCDSCIIHPEKCHFDQGTCREPDWGEKFCMQDHIIYLANSSSIKVGITRATQVPTRWIDQGAIQALPIIRVRSRLQSGMLEVMFKQHITDKTNWRSMLQSDGELLDLEAERQRLLDVCKEEIEEMRDRFGFFGISILNGVDTLTIRYPVREVPDKIPSFNFDKDALVEGTLLGIKGQYLIFDTGVINLRRFGGYGIELRVQ